MPHQPDRPNLQIALDLLNLTAAVELVLMLDGLIDVVEAGTPLIKRFGMQAVQTLRAAAPDLLLLADMKTMDAGRIEAELAFDAGADLMTVLAGASDATIVAALEVAHRTGKQIVVDLLGVDEPVKRAVALAALGVDFLGVHAGTDARLAGASQLLEQARAVGNAIDVPLVLAGGVDQATIPPLLALSPATLVIGSAITGASDPHDAARTLRQTIDTYWSGHEASHRAEPSAQRNIGRAGTG